MFIMFYTIMTYLYTSNYGNLFKVPELRENFTNRFVKPQIYSHDVQVINMQNTSVRATNLLKFSANRSAVDLRNTEDDVSEHIIENPEQRILAEDKIKQQHTDITTKDFQKFDPEWDVTFNVRNRVVPKIIMDMHGSLEYESSDAFGQNIEAIRCLSIAEHQITTSGVAVKFNFSNIQNKELINGAELLVYRQHSSESNIIRVYQLQPNEKQEPDDSVQSADVHELLGVTYVSKYDHGWQKFKVQKSLENWQNEEHNLGFLILVTDTWGNLIDPKYFGLDITGLGSSPLLVIRFLRSPSSFVHEEQAINTTSVNHFQSPNLEETCTRQHLSIDFVQKGYNFIIHPKIITLNKCIGTCQTVLNDFTSHAKFLYILQKSYGCCVPSRYSALTIMFYDSFGNIVIKRYNNMVVENCECR